MISKCQGRCGKNITPNDILIVRTSGKTSSTDKKTDQQRGKFGPMHLHFQENCLKNFGEKDHTTGKSFVFEKIEIDEGAKRKLTEEDLEFLKSLRIYWAWRYV